MKYREVCFYEDYFLSFYDQQSTKVKRKIDAVIEIVQQEKKQFHVENILMIQNLY